MLGLYDDTLSCKVECKSLRKSLPCGSFEAVSTEYMGRGQPNVQLLLDIFNSLALLMHDMATLPYRILGLSATNS